MSYSKHNEDIDPLIAKGVESLSSGSATFLEDEVTPEVAAEKLQEKSIDPFDLFGDHTLTGRQDLTRDMVLDVIFDYASDAGKRPGLNAGPIAVGCLVAAATAIREGWKIQPKIHDTDWMEKPILWVAVTGSSGAKKSHALNASSMPMKIIDEQNADNNEESLKDYKREKAQHNELMKSWRKEGPFSICVGCRAHRGLRGPYILCLR